MSETAGGRSPSEFVIYPALFASGAAALMSEVSWSRQVGLVIGQTAGAGAVVLAGFFAGMAAGQWVGSWVAVRVRPAVSYAAAELAAAAWSCAVPPLLASAPADWPTGWCALALLPATIPIGATLPLAAALMADRGRPKGPPRLPLAYAANTAGGLAGVGLATALMACGFGVRATGYAAAALSAAAGIAVVVSARRIPGARNAACNPDRAAAPLWWPVVAAVSGFGTLALEVLYARMFALVFHNSTYTFAAVLAVFLCGLALGAALAPAAVRKWPPRVVAAAAFSLGGAAAAASAVLFSAYTGLEYFEAGGGFFGYLFRVCALVAVVVLPPATLLGVVLPSVFGAAGGAAKPAGRLSAVNTAAGAVGSLAAGFVLPPLLGLWGAFGLVALLFGATGAALLRGRGRSVAAVAAMAAALAAAALPASGPRRAAGDERLVRRWETAYGWVDVVRRGGGGKLSVRQNLHYRHGSTGTAAAREYRQGRLPLLLHPGPDDVAFIGLGTGLTAAAAVADGGVKRAVVVELVPEVAEAARLLAAANLGVVGHPKVELRIGDGRNYLAGAGRRFDVVVSDLFVPWESRTGYLYTAEFYATVRRSLKPGGHFCQWLALYQLGPAEFELIADSFASAFPHATLWWGQFDARHPIVALVGADAPLGLDPDRLAERWAAAGALPGGADPDLAGPADVDALYLGRWPARPGRPLNTDEHPRLEFAAPRSQRSGAVLAGPTLMAYFDAVLAVLPAGGVPPGGAVALDEATASRRRYAQRLSLFGPARP